MIFEGTKNVLDAAIAAGVQRFVYMSSLTVHGEKEFFGADETTPRVNPPFYYGQAKNMAEDYLEEAYRAGKIETIVIRPGYIIFGENDFTGIYQVFENIKFGRFGYINGGKPYVHLFMFKILWMELFMLEADLRLQENLSLFQM